MSVSSDAGVNLMKSYSLIVDISSGWLTSFQVAIFITYFLGQFKLPISHLPLCLRAIVFLCILT